MTPQQKAQTSRSLLKDLIAGKTFSELASNTCGFANIFNKTDKSFDFDFADISGTINNIAGAPSVSPHVCLWAADGTLLQEID